MPFETLTTTTDPSIAFPERINSACGVGLRRNLPRRDDLGRPLLDASGQFIIDESHQVIEEGLTIAGHFEYRAGEDDGVGIKINGFGSRHFNKKIASGDFVSSTGEVLQDVSLEKGLYAIGQYFLPHDPTECDRAKALIQDQAKANGLNVAGWRDLSSAIDSSVLSDKARRKEPAQWQAILLPETITLSGEFAINLEQAAFKAGVDMAYEAKRQGVALHVISLSSNYIVFKGLIPPKKLGLYFKDLQDEDFTATGTEKHARFSTNTESEPQNAQPCQNILHNGELNSAPANAEEMRAELDAKGFKGVYPDQKLSDSMQFKADLHNQMLMKGVSFLEAFVRLMPPRFSDEELADESLSAEVAAMLQCFRLERTGYNGPAFITGDFMGYSVAKADESGLRPARWGIIEEANGNQQFHAASDDYLEPPVGGKIIKKRHLEPGGMVAVTPAGDVLETKAILDLVCARYHATDSHYFQHLLAERTVSLSHTAIEGVADVNPVDALSTADLNRILYASGGDKESQEDIRHMAEKGFERVIAMGDDTDLLHSTIDFVDIAGAMHQLFAQVSAPSGDPINEPEDFWLNTALGPVLESNADGLVSQEKLKIVLLESPILGIHDLNRITHHPDSGIRVYELDTSFEVPTTPDVAPVTALREALAHLLKAAESRARAGGGILILSDEHVGPTRVAIPDVIAVAAVRKHLENKHIIRNVSIVADSYHIAGPHHASTLLAFGAKSVYPRGAYAKINKLFDDVPLPGSVNRSKALEHYAKALQKSLLKTMGKMGLNDVNNYINGRFVAALGLDLSADGHDLADHPTLANIFKGLYSPLRGINLTHVANSVLRRHQQAYNPGVDFTLLPHSGYYMPEEKGIKHGYGPVVVNAFTEWLKMEEMNATLSRMHTIFEKRYQKADFISQADSRYTPEEGFLDPRIKDDKGYYPPAYLERFRSSFAFKKMIAVMDDYRKKNPTSLHDYLSIKQHDPEILRKWLRIPEGKEIQSQQAIRALLYAGSMSQGALTVSHPDSPLQKLGAHETLTRAMNAIGSKSASGEGGEAPHDLRDPFRSTSSKQVASGRFGVSAMQIQCAEEVEIKVAQGAKPGEGGQLPGLKVSVRFAAQRGGLPGTDFISPPPHHDTYSIEDLKQLIRDIKRVNPNANVSVKLVASQGIGTIAVGVAKAGADVINIAGNSGGTGAASLSSIKFAGMSAELGLAEVDKALRRAKMRDLVKLRVSGGFKTPEDVLVAAILGADLFEFGTTAMLTLGCKMQRTCNHSCQPGVTTDGHLFKGDQLNTERYFVNMAAAIQDKLRDLGVSSLHDLRGRTELLDVCDPKINSLYDFSAILDRSNLPPLLDPAELKVAEDKRQLTLQNETEDKLVLEIQAFFAEHPNDMFCSDLAKPIKLNTQDLSFGARVAGAFVRHLEAHPEAKIILNTTGNAGQSLGFVMPKGMMICHHGSVQDGCVKSMTGGVLCLVTPHQRADYRADENTLGGNALGYGASGGEVYVNGVVGNRAFVLGKGVTAVLEGAGQRAFEFMTSGTGMILGQVGKGLCTSASGGIVFVYDPAKKVDLTTSVRHASSEERRAYEHVIKKMLADHLEYTGSLKAKAIINTFDLNDFNVLIPKSMDKINTLDTIIDVIKTYQLRESPITLGMQVWLEQKALAVVHRAITESESSEKISELRRLLLRNGVLTEVVCQKLLHMMVEKPLHAPVAVKDIEDIVPQHRALSHRKPKTLRPVDLRLKGGLDESLLDAIEHIDRYAAELTHNAKGCSSCGAQSCAGGDDVGTGCPSGKNINTINSTLQRLGPILNGRLTKAQWGILREAFEIQIKKSPFTRYTGAACPEPCKDACTETIPDSGEANPNRDGKLVGEAVHIKEIELYLDQVGRALGWFNGQKKWLDEEVNRVFGSEALKHKTYDVVMKHYQTPFSRPAPALMKADKELVIIGSGPAAMQMAFEALRDGVNVRMYEKSDKPGGLLVDGIPGHKFDKDYIKEDFSNLERMGLKLHLHSEVLYDASKGGFYVKDDPEATPLVNIDNRHQHVALCVGAGRPKKLGFGVTLALDAGTQDLPLHQRKIIQAVDLLKVGNDIDALLKNVPDLSDAERKAFIADYFSNPAHAHMNPFGKRIVVLGGGDTAKDVYSLLARYFSLELQVERGRLTILIRGPKPVDKKGIHDSYPKPSKTPTKDDKLQAEELDVLKKLGKYGDGDALHLVEPMKIEVNTEGKLTVYLTESKFKYQELIERDAQLKELSDALPREMRPRNRSDEVFSEINEVDMVICALGFQGAESIPIIQATQGAGLNHVSIAGDAANVQPQIIVGAQASGYDTYYNKVRGAMGIFDERPTLSRPIREPSGLATHSMFASSKQPIPTQIEMKVVPAP